MTDARQEDQDRDVAPVVLATRVDDCAAAVCKDKILVGQPIKRVDGSWCHFEGSCVDDFEAQLVETSEPDDRPWRACVPGTILQDGLTEEQARERAARAEATRPADAYGHAYVEQYDEPKVCPTCGVVEGTGETL